MILSFLGTVMLFVGGLGSFAGVSSSTVLDEVFIMRSDPDVLSISSLCSGDCCVPHWDRFLDRGTSVFGSHEHERRFLRTGINANEPVLQTVEAGEC
jgi:hypothetical protein